MFNSILNVFCNSERCRKQNIFYLSILSEAYKEAFHNDKISQVYLKLFDYAQTEVFKTG